MIKSESESSFGRWLGRHPVAFTIAASFAAFGAYTCMYAFRKPFTAATFEGETLFGLKLKVLLVVGQMLGYALSKIIGIKFVSEAPASRRIAMIALLIGSAGGALLLLPLVPQPARPLCMFINGLPLGMIWGLVFSFLEGRRVTEFLGLGMSVSFIFASGWTKSVGGFLVKKMQVPELWMPLLTGLLFVPLLAVCLWVLAHLPNPDSKDIADRTARRPMNGAERKAYLLAFFPVIGSLTFSYFLLSVYRDLRDTFMADILKELGYTGSSSIFASVETFAGLGVLLALAGFWYVRDHWRAIGIYHLIIGLGALLVGASTLAFTHKMISSYWWLAGTGLGVYLGYVPFNSILFDRLLAATRQVGTATFLIYVADSSGYLGSSVLYLANTFGKGVAKWTNLTLLGGEILAVAIPICLVVSWTALRPHRQSNPSAA